VVRHVWAAVVASLALEACAHAAPSTARRGYQAQVITEVEIVEANVANAYDAIKKLRANFLTYRGKTTFRGAGAPEPTVYLDDQPYGGISSLRTIRAGQIAEIRLYRSWEATTKFGTGNMDGVIAVTTRK
jgi:hypothetical protein